MPNTCTLSEKYMLSIALHKNNIINDIHELLLVNENERSNKLYTEYFFGRESSLPQMIMNMDKDECKKMGYICRCFAPNTLGLLSDFPNYISFISGWLEGSVRFDTSEEINTTFCFTHYDILDLYNYVFHLINERSVEDDSLIVLAEILCKSPKMSIHILTELCFYMKLRKIPTDQIQNKIIERLKGAASISSLDYTIHGVLCYYKSLFCLFDLDTDIDWNSLYNETLLEKHVSEESRGFKPAQAFIVLVKKVYSLFLGENHPYDEVLLMTIELFGFRKKNGTGSCDDFGAHEILPYIKKVFLQFFINNPSFPDISKLCTDLLEIFIGTNAHYYKELASIYYFANRKDLYLQIVDHWCGLNGIIWKNEYDLIEDICQSIINQLNHFGEFELAQNITARMQLRLLGYVGHKDYSLNGLLECYKLLPLNEEKLIKHGMELLTISDYASEMGDNRINIEDILFEDAINLGFKYVDALYEIKNSPGEFMFWRECLISALFGHIEDLFQNNEQLINLYNLVNTWIKFPIEHHSIPYRNNVEALNRYNEIIIKQITDESIKAQLIALGNCTPSKKDTFEYGTYNSRETQYAELLDQLKQTGYNVDFESKIVVITNDPSFYYSCSLILNIWDLLSDKDKPAFITNVVIPYLHRNNKYGNRSNGNMSIISEMYSYFTKEDWLSIFKDISKRIVESKLDLDLFYSVYDDLDFISLYFNYQFNSDSIEKIFIDRCQLHYSIISAAGLFPFSIKEITLDSNISEFCDFVKKQIGSKVL